MMKKIMKQLLMVLLIVFAFSVFGMTAYATQTEETETEAEEEDLSNLRFEIALFTYQIDPDATQADMPPGFTLRDWEFRGVPVKVGMTPNSNMVCFMASDIETGYDYRFIYDSNCDMFVPYFGGEVEDGYIYTVPIYEGAEVPYGFMESYFVIQTVPMFTYMREDAELTQEEIAVGSLSEDNYLVFLMMDETGKEVHYTYDLIDRTFQRSLLQLKDAEKVTELNEVIDALHVEIGQLNSNNAERMNGRLALIAILIAAVIIMAGIIVNLLLKISRMKNEENEEDSDDEEEHEQNHENRETEPESEDEFFTDEEETEAVKEPMEEDDDDWEIIDLDLEDE